MKRSVAASLLCAVIATGCGAGGERVVVAAGTTLVDSGFIDRVVEAYPGDAMISVLGVSSREALALGDAGSASLLITHLPEAEAEFLGAHPEAEQRPVFTSRFVVVGPPGVDLSTSSAAHTFASIAALHRPFVSRSDGSGTAAREREIWELAGVDPVGESWYTETGQGMGFTLQVADQLGAFTLAEVGTLRASDALTLTTYAIDDPVLDNPYRVTLTPTAGEDARAVFEWLVSEAGADAMFAVNEELFDDVLYVPATVPS